MSTTAPRVFISHSQQDKQRFVTRFATALREQGIDAWVDDWEMLPGDSLVDKIFEEGLKQADAMVVVLSEHSVKSKWVREELNAGVVARIQKGTRLIPILIDDVEVPQALKHTLWVVAHRPEDFDQALAKVVSAIFEHRKRPPLGPKPGFAEVVQIQGLQASDTLVFRTFGDRTLTMPHITLIDTEDVWNDVERQGLSRDSFKEALGVLENVGYLERSRELSRLPRSFCLTHSGMEQYLRHFFPGYAQAIRSVAADLLNNEERERNLAAMLLRLTIPEVIARHILHNLKAAGHIEMQEMLSGFLDITEVRAHLRRML